MGNVKSVKARRPSLLRVVAAGLVGPGFVEERVEVILAVGEMELLLEQLPLGTFFSFEVAGGIFGALHEVEVPTHDRKLGWVGGQSNPELLDHHLLDSKLILIGGEQAEVNQFQRELATRVRDEGHLAVPMQARRQRNIRELIFLGYFVRDSGADPRGVGGGLGASVGGVI